MQDLWQAIIAIVGIAGMFLYFLTNRIHAPGRWFFQDTWLDKYIPLVPYFIIAYVGLYPYMFVTIALMWDTDLSTQFFTCFAIAAWSAALAWYLAPAGIVRRRRLGPDFFSRMIVWLYEHDHENNTIPSSHVFYSLICSYFLMLAYPDFQLLFVAIGILISISTVFVKQHHIADILGGIVWAASAIAASYLVG